MIVILAFQGVVLLQDVVSHYMQLEATVAIWGKGRNLQVVAKRSRGSDEKASAYPIGVGRVAFRHMQWQ